MDRDARRRREGNLLGVWLTGEDALLRCCSGPDVGTVPWAERVFLRSNAGTGAKGFVVGTSWQVSRTLEVEVDTSSMTALASIMISAGYACSLDWCEGNASSGDGRADSDDVGRAASLVSSWTISAEVCPSESETEGLGI